MLSRILNKGRAKVWTLLWPVHLSRGTEFTSFPFASFGDHLCCHRVLFFLPFELFLDENEHFSREDKLSGGILYLFAFELNRRPRSFWLTFLLENPQGYISTTA